MTEILLLDQYYKEQHDIDKRIKERYLDEWMLGDSKNITPQFVKQGNVLQIDITLDRRVMAISFKSTKEQNAAEEQRMIDFSEKNIIEIIREAKNSISLKNGIELLCAVPDCSNNNMIKLAEHMKKEIESRYPIKFCFVAMCWVG